MANLEITPAGNQLFQVDIETRNEARTIEVAVPDGFMDRLDVEGDPSMQDVVQATVEFVLEREGIDGIDGVDGEIRLDRFADRHPDLISSISRRVGG